MKKCFRKLGILGWVLTVAMICCGHGCCIPYYFGVSEFNLATNSPLPKWLDKDQFSRADFKYILHETVFTTKGRVTLEIRLPGSNTPVKFNGVWEPLPGEDERYRKEGVSLLKMTFNGVPEIYEFRYTNVIVIKKIDIERDISPIINQPNLATE